MVNKLTIKIDLRQEIGNESFNIVEAVLKKCHSHVDTYVDGRIVRLDYSWNDAPLWRALQYMAFDRKPLLKVFMRNRPPVLVSHKIDSIILEHAHHFVDHPIPEYFVIKTPQQAQAFLNAIM